MATIPSLYCFMNSPADGRVCLECPTTDVAIWQRTQALLRRADDGKTDPILDTEWQPVELTITTYGEEAVVEDFYVLNGRPIVSERVRDLSRQLLKDCCEFLPVNVVAKQKCGDEKPEKLKKALNYYVIRPLINVSFASGTKIWRATGTPILDQAAFRPIDLEGKHLFGIAASPGILVSDQLRKLLVSPELIGAKLKKLDWTESQKLPKPKAPPKVGDPPAAPPIKSSMELTPAIWECCREHMAWLARAIKLRGGDVVTRLNIGKVVSEDDVAAIQKRMKKTMPREFKRFVTEFAGSFSFDWYLGEVDESLPEEISEVVHGGGGRSINLKDMARLSSLEDQITAKGPNTIDNPLIGRLPFFEFESDYLCFDQRESNDSCPIVFVPHDGGDEHVLAPSFDDFIARWTRLGCPGPQYWELSCFMNEKRRTLDDTGKNADRWRRWLQTGV